MMPQDTQEKDIRIQHRHFPISSLKNLATFEHDIQVAMSRVRPPPQTSYNDVVALFIRWEDSDSDAVEMEEELKETFRDIYHYNIESYTIKSTTEHAVQHGLSSWLRKVADIHGRNEDSLYIVVYSGSSAWCNGKVHLFKKMDEFSEPCTPYLDFDKCATDAGIYNALAHKLFIFDCDVASSTWHNSEVIVAGPCYNCTNADGRGSFLRGLIDDLIDTNGTSTSAASIVARMTRDIFNTTPQTRIGNIAPPAHYFARSGMASIILQQLCSQQSSTPHTSPDSQYQSEPRNDSHFRALISVQFAKDARIDEYGLRQTARIQSGLYGPNLQIDVAGFFAKSTGLFAQFTVPYELLLGLNQDCGAYRFIEDVESENTLITNWH